MSGATPTFETTAIMELQCFLASYAAFRPASPVLDARAGLVNFLEKAGSLLCELRTAAPVVKATAVLNPQRLAAALASLQMPVRQARANGAFLQVWSVAGLKRNELRNAAVLAWLIDPNGSHGHGPAVLSGLLSAAAERVPSWPSHGVDLSRVSVRTEEHPLGSDRDRVDIAVDIAVDGPDFIYLLR